MLTIPKRLRACCLYRRGLLGEIARVAARTVTVAIRGPPRAGAVGPTNGLVYWITSEERTQPILVTNFARLADSLLTAAGVRR